MQHCAQPSCARCEAACGASNLPPRTQDYRLKREEWAELKDKMPFGQVPVLEVRVLGCNYERQPHHHLTTRCSRGALRWMASC